MERYEIRGALACLSCATVANADDQLAKILAVVHTAMLQDTVRQVYEQLCACGYIGSHENRNGATTRRRHEWLRLVERELG